MQQNSQDENGGVLLNSCVWGKEKKMHAAAEKELVGTCGSRLLNFDHVRMYEGGYYVCKSK